MNVQLIVADHAVVANGIMAGDMWLQMELERRSLRKRPASRRRLVP